MVQAIQLSPTEQKTQYDEEGYLVFPELLDAIELAQLRAALAEVLHELNRLASANRVAIVVTLRAATRFDRQGQLVVKSRHETEAARCTWCSTCSS